ncbi:MAG: LysE family translocator [Pseudomonadota bacterium]
MEIAHLIAFNVALLAAIASPGPSLLYLIKTTLTQGRAAGIVTGAGLAFMAALWTLAALLGLDGIFSVFPWAYVVLKTLGAFYLIWIAIQTWRHARSPIEQSAPKASHERAFLAGILINLANPKSVFFAAAVIVVIFPADLTGAEKSIIFLNHLAVELVVQPALAFLLSTGVIRTRYLAAKPFIDRCTAAILGALGVRLLLSR